MKDLANKITGNTLTAAEWNEVPSEIQNVIEGLGQSLSSGDLNQLGKSIAGYVANGSFYTDSGAADAYVLSVIGSKQAPTAYTDGFEAEFKVGNTNTGASTINVAGLGVKNITATANPGTLTTGDIVRLRYNTGSGEFDILNNTGATATDASETVKGIAELATQAETDNGTDDTRIVTPLKLNKSPQTASAWVNFNGTGTVAIRGQFNVTSITDNGVGLYTVNFANALANANYAPAVNNSQFETSGPQADVDSCSAYNLSTTSFNVATFTSSTVKGDSSLVSIVVMGGN